MDVFASQVQPCALTIEFITTSGRKQVLLDSLKKQAIGNSYIYIYHPTKASETQAQTGFLQHAPSPSAVRIGTVVDASQSHSAKNPW